jgi:alginate O-acetyltransferase complex protein AlgI
MVFNSFSFIIFFVCFFLLYWLLFQRSLRAQNILLLIGCYVFYARWDWHFLILLIGYSALNFVLGIYIAKAESLKRKKWLSFIATIVGLGSLLYFKYFNFFVASFIDVCNSLHIKTQAHVVELFLPVGISFYTFRVLSYIYDIRKGKINPTNNWVAFFSFVAFFPSLLSGPIDKASLLLPQLEKKRTFNYLVAVDAMRQILWGLFKKRVIADNLSIITDDVFNNYHNYNGSAALIGLFYFTIQLYADFSGYSDMAIGFAKLLGFNTTQNFNYPFFAQNIAEFWRRWHMSLTTWLTEYVFTPLSILFRDFDKLGLIMAILINFLLIGFWHGASWSFVIFGLLHGLFYIPLILKGTLNKKSKAKKDAKLPTLVAFKNMALTFFMVSFSFILFKCDGVGKSLAFAGRIFSKSLFLYPNRINLIYIAVILLFIIFEWIQRYKQYTLQIDSIKSLPVRYGIYYVLIFSIFFFSSSQIAQFIYFKF